MKDLKLWQKAGLVVAIVSGLTLGGLTPKYDSKGLESKLLTIGMSVAEAKTTESNGYQIPDLTGYTKVGEFYVDFSKKIDGKETSVEKYVNKDGDVVYKSSYKGQVYLYAVGPKNGQRYGLRDSKCSGIFDEKYASDEEIEIPDCLLK